MSPHYRDKFAKSVKWASILMLALAGDAHAADGGAPAYLTAPRTITGTVRDLSGTPVAGAIVSFHPWAYPAVPRYVEATTPGFSGVATLQYPTAPKYAEV